MRYLLLFLVALMPLCAFSQESADEKSGPPLTLESAIKEALDKSPEIRAAEAEIQAAKGELTAASSYGVQPTLSASVETSFNNLDRLEISVGQSLPVGGKLALAKQAGAANVEALEARAKAVRASVAAQASRAYVSFWLASSLLAITNQRAALAKTSREGIEKRSASGDTSKLELLLVQAEEERVKAEVALADGALEQARVQLAAVLGRRLSSPVVISPQKPLSAPVASIDSLLEQGESTPAFNAASKEVDAASAALELSRRGLVPSPTVRLGASFNQLVIDSADLLGTPAGLTGIKQNEGQLFIGLESPIPVLQKSYQGSLEASRGQLAATEAKRDATKRNVSADLLAARSRIVSASAAEELLRTSTPRYEEAAALTEKGYSSGQLGIDALLLARGRVYEAEVALISAQAKTLEAEIDLRELLGKVLGE